MDWMDSQQLVPFFFFHFMTPSQTQIEWLPKYHKRHASMQHLSCHEICWQRFMLYHRRKLFIGMPVLFVCLALLLVQSHVPPATDPKNTTRTANSAIATGKSSLRHSNRFRKISFPPTPDELQRINAELRDPDDVIVWASQQFPHSLVQVSSFGPTGLVIMDKLHQLGLFPQIPVITIDTLHLFQETYDLMKRVRRQYPDMSLQVYTPQNYDQRQAFDAEYGADLWKTDPNKYGTLTKVEPMERGLKEHHAQAWITGRRRSQGGERTELLAVEYDADQRRIKLNPLAFWSYDQVWNYIRTHKVPYNALHDKGYKSIGDVMTSRAVDDSAPERSGRFVGLNRTECGMHEHLEKIQQMKAKSVENEEEFVMPFLPCGDCHDVDLTNFQQDIVLTTSRDILLEFYSPLCGACQDFAPTLKRIVEKVKDRITVSRFDITDSDVTNQMHEQGFNLEVTPTLFLVQHNPFRVTKYEGSHGEFDIIDWLERKRAKNTQ